MSDELNEKLRKILRIRPGTSDVLRNRESQGLEFKKSFGLGSCSAYVRTMISFANNRGGFIVFGVEPSPHRLIGVNRAFHNADPSRLASFIRDHASPELSWEQDTIQVAGKELGLIYVAEAREKPVIATRTKAPDLTEAEIYYRYHGQSACIRFAELKRLIDERLAQERRAWMKHLEAISRAGPLSVGILDAVDGKLYGGGGAYLIQESLLEKLKFIREGRFVDTGGEPTLQLVGDLHPVGGIVAEREVPVSIHADDLIRTFLTGAELEPAEAKRYLLETAYQNTHLLPVFYYAREAQLSNEVAADELEQSQSSYPQVRKKVVARLRGEDFVGPMGPVFRKPLGSFLGSETEFRKEIVRKNSQKHIRSVVREVLHLQPEWITANLDQIAIARICEAVSHLRAPESELHSEGLRTLLLQIYEQYFTALPSLGKTTFRKAIAFLDQNLFGVEGPETVGE